jgi:hypothetical protein
MLFSPRGLAICVVQHAHVATRIYVPSPTHATRASASLRIILSGPACILLAASHHRDAGRDAYTVGECGHLLQTEPIVPATPFPTPARLV